MWWLTFSHYAESFDTMLISKYYKWSVSYQRRVTSREEQNLKSASVGDKHKHRRDATWCVFSPFCSVFMLSDAWRTHRVGNMLHRQCSSEFMCIQRDTQNKIYSLAKRLQSSWDALKQVQNKKWDWWMDLAQICKSSCPIYFPDWIVCRKKNGKILSDGSAQSNAK